ncbi:GNAT family N-acetyltransferase [Bailinhaonella thermotolerans]|uniref:GNAT family N-acetyltransferase n=1 Tax=Bailinhaonella thermotolerans TaxID=1070861 RepID=A0A3A4A830_9ACTN|nr:GNAT family N-acetyltransferase [Bailinhaonella thermotolerans]RJL24119.1 GNAT family N-acetyltransferase [Bailinhaonella thermotolerans]
MNDVVIRPIGGRDELDLFCSLPYGLNHELAGDLEAGRRLPGWMWVALRGDRVVARLAWWGRGDGVPYLLDILDLAEGEADRVEIGSRLFEAASAAVLPAGEPPVEWTRYVPPAWRDDPVTRAGVEDRMEILARAGARPLVERLRLEWRPGTPIAEDDGRLRFREPAGRDELVSLMALVLDGTLDAHSIGDLARMSPEEAAVQQYEDELLSYKSPREWWRVATTPDGEPVGFVIPARNNYNPIIAYIGVVPAHRGRGHIDRLLAEGTRVLAAQDVSRVRASTDLGNVPMARAFARAGYIAFEHEINMTWS